MTNEVKRQLIKALAYDKNADKIKECMDVSDDDINSITTDEIEAEKAYHREMGYFIAYLYGTTVEKLVSLNNIKDRENIYPGQRLRVK